MLKIKSNKTKKTDRPQVLSLLWLQLIFRHFLNKLFFFGFQEEWMWESCIGFLSHQKNFSISKKILLKFVISLLHNYTSVPNNYCKIYFNGKCQTFLQTLTFSTFNNIKKSAFHWIFFYNFLVYFVYFLVSACLISTIQMKEPMLVH